MLDRRQILSLLAGASAASPYHAARAQGDPRIAAFNQFLKATSEQDIERAASFRELDFREQEPTSEQRLAQPGLPRRFSSDKTISPRAKDLLIRFEISSRSTYDAKYRKPTWPKGQSGVTIGIGYDIGYSSKALFEEDWRGIIPQASIEKLDDTCGIKGNAARDAVFFVQDVDVPWQAASDQLDRMLKFVSGETINAFPGAATLSEDFFGALVSLVYNRGGGLRSSPNDRLDRRLEMRNIRELLQAGKKSDVAFQIRKMKRIWEGDPDARGLLERRESEARLFELGL